MKFNYYISHDFIKKDFIKFYSINKDKQVRIYKKYKQKKDFIFIFIINNLYWKY